jgi:hypothetical protein
MDDFVACPSSFSERREQRKPVPPVMWVFFMIYEHVIFLKITREWFMVPLGHRVVFPFTFHNSQMS